MRREIRVIFVEDDPSSVEFMVHALRTAGYSPDWVRVDNARDFEVALHDQPDIVIADYYVPDFYGIDVLYLIDHIEIDLPVVVVSAALPQGSAARLTGLGASDFVRKDQLGRLGKVVHDALAMTTGECRLADRASTVAETRGLAQGAPLASPHPISSS